MTDRRRYSSARTEDSYHYSDDFSDEDPMPVKSAPEKQRTREFTYATEAHSYLRSGGVRGRNQGKGRGRGRGGQGRTSQARSDTQLDVVTKHLLSASRLKMNELQNQLEEMRNEMKIVTEENKLYKRMQHKQEKALVKFEDRESELPQMIQAHNNEVRSLREQLRRTRDKYEKTDRYLRDAEDELERVNAKFKKYKALSDQKDLAERSDLDRRLNKAELAIEEKECRIRELERHMENVKKNHRHELGIERARYKDTQKQLEELKESNFRLEAVLKEKERQLDAKNIYSNRFGGKPSSYNGTPAESPAPWRQSLKKKSESMSELAPRSKARAYEEKRKAEEKKKERPAPSQAEHRQKWEDEDREKEKEKSSEGPNFNFKSLDRQDSDADFWRRQEERYKQDKDNRERQEEERRKKAEEQKKEEVRFQQQREQFQRDMEERERRERERREADEREHQAQQKREREEQERREKEKREAELRERERKEKERQAKEERERLDNDPRLAEERRKKDELLHRLQQLDANRDGSQPASDSFAPADSTTRRRGAGDHSSDPFAPSPSRRADKDPFAPSTGDSSYSSPSSKKDYAFTRSVENMHQGKPAREDVSVPYIDRHKKTRATREDDDSGGYQPSFSGAGRGSGSEKKKTLSLFDDDDVKPAPKSNPDRKAKLMSDLFGSQSATNGSSAKKDDGEEFFLTSKSPPPKQLTQPKKSPGFPWDGPSSSSTKANGSNHRESSTLFAGGAALVDDDVSGNSGPRSTMLPKRSRQPATTFNSKPSMIAVDDLDDDIEEVVL